MVKQVSPKKLGEKEEPWKKDVGAVISRSNCGGLQFNH